MKTNFTLAPIFSDHMMFQAGKPIRIFGTCRPGIELSIHFRNLVTVLITSGEKFCSELPAASIVKEPFEFVISSGDQVVTVRDCLVGDVFIASGQSNMQFTLKEGIPVDAADNPDIRFYEVPKVPYEGANLEFSWLYPSNPHWTACSKESSPWFSAIGYFVSQRLQKELDIPIGIISCNLGDTSVFSWTDMESLRSTPGLSRILGDYAEAMEKYENIEAYNSLFHRQIPRLMEFWGEIDKGRKAGLNADDANNEAFKKYPDPYIPMGPKHYNRPSGMFDSLLDTIVPFASKGVLFYQGESNHQDCRLYELGFLTMMKGWRRVFKDSALPFVFVQVAGYSYPGVGKDSIQIVREAQQNAIDLEDNRFMVTAIDLGEAENIHPKDKSVVADRLSNVVLEKIYHHNSVHDSLSPAFMGYVACGDDILIKTRFNFQNLVSRSGKNFGFKVSTDHEIFVDCLDVILEENGILFKNAGRIQEIRYAFEPFPNCDIYTMNGLPLLPFRINIER